MGSRMYVEEFAFDRSRKKSSTLTEGRRRKRELVFLSPSTYSKCQLEEQSMVIGMKTWLYPNLEPQAIIQNLAKE